MKRWRLPILTYTFIIISRAAAAAASTPTLFSPVMADNNPPPLSSRSSLRSLCHGERLLRRRGIQAMEDVGADRGGEVRRRPGHETTTVRARWAPRRGWGRPPSCSSRRRSGLSCNSSGCRIQSLPCRRALRASCTQRSPSSARLQWRTP